MATPELSEETTRTMTDAQLVAAWQATDGEAGDPVVELLAAEMEQREIDF